MAEKQQYRFLARVVLETTAPVSVGSGNKSIMTDAPVVRDVNGLPYIPGTAIAGLIRHSLEETERLSLMGSQSKGSQLVVTEAKILDCHGKVIDGLVDWAHLDEDVSLFLNLYKQLPIRQHVRIGHRGATVKGGKFDEEVVVKGTRFCFELEMSACDKKEEEKFQMILDAIRSCSFRIGAGSRSGFGSIKVISCKKRLVDFSDRESMKWYLDKPASLSSDWSGDELEVDTLADKHWTEFRLVLNPSDFILFGSGMGNENADVAFVTEPMIDWGSGIGTRVDAERVLLVPAASVKGAIAHRVAYYYNKRQGYYADKLPEGTKVEDFVGKKNPAVKALFGSEGNKIEGRIVDKQRGNVLVSDIIQQKRADSRKKLLNHVSIDRFTGGTIDGALYSEEVLYAKEENISLSLLVNKTALQEPGVEEALVCTLKDLCSSMLPLGGGVNRGHGCFEGKLFKDGDLLYENN